MSLIGNPDTPVSYVADYMQACVGLFGIPAGGFTDTLETYGAATDWNVESLYAAMLNSSIGRSIFAPGVSNQTFATTLVGKLGGSLLADATEAAAIDVLKAALDGGMSQAAVAMAAVEYVAGLDTTDADFGSVAQQFQNRVTIANYYTFSSNSPSSTLSTLTAVLSGVSNTTDVSDPEGYVDSITDPAVSTGQTYTLTTGADNIIGTTGNDTINGAMDDNTDPNRTFTVLDSISAGTGTDTLNITVDTSGAGVALPAATYSGIEVWSFRNVSGQTLTVDNALMTGETDMISAVSTAQVDFTNVAAGTAIGVTGNGVATNGATNATYAASATAGVLNVSGGTTAGAIAINGAGFTSLTINSTGATNVTGAVSSSGTSITTTTINATTAFETSGLTVGTVAGGTQALVITGAAGDVAATASAATKSAVTLGAFDADYKSINASAMTAGGVSGTLSATTTATFTGGAGADRITTSTDAQTGAVDAGAGTDILTLAASAHLDTTTEGAVYKNFEILGVADNVSIDMDLLTASTITGIIANDAGSATSVTDMNATQAGDITVVAYNGAMTLGVKGATTAGTQNSMAIKVTDGDTTSSETIAGGAGDWTIGGVETMTITATDDLSLSTMANITGLNSLTVTGAGDVAITTAVHVATANETINFSGLTTASTFNFSGTTTNAIAFTGGSAVDTVTDSVVGGNVITTGAGADSITLTDKTSGTSGDIVTAGAGADTVSFGTAMGQTAMDTVTFMFAAGDSVSNSISATDVTNADTISAIAWNDGGTATAGQKFTIDTEVSCGQTTITAGSTAATLGTTTVTNAYDFFIYYTGANVYVYQDTDGDKLLEVGEFMVKLVGDAAFAAATGNTNDFTISSGNLVFTSNDAA